MSRIIQSYLINITLPIYIFTSINREFAVFGIDLRYIISILSAIIIVIDGYSLISNRQVSDVSTKTLRLSFRKNLSNTLLLSYLLIALVSNVQWIGSVLPLRLTDLINLIVVFLLNICIVYFCIVHSSEIKTTGLEVILLISCVILTVSQIAAYCSIPLNPFLSDSSVRVLQEGGEHYNLFGQHFRISGFAEDPNYACLFNLIGLILSIRLFDKDKKALICAALCAGGIALSWSRTIVFGSAFVAIALFLIYRVNALRAYRDRIQIAAFILLLCVVLSVPLLKVSDSLPVLQTILTRFELWERASHLFLNSPILGNGLTSFRSYNMLEVPVWYVHCHSTFWSALSESGIISFIALSGALILALINTKEFALKIIVATFILFCVNFDATYLQITIVIISIFPYIFPKAYWQIDKMKDCIDG